MAFEHVLVIDPLRGGQREIDIGRLAEDLLFYGKVSLHVGPGALRELVQGVGAGPLLALMERGSLKVVYADNVVAVQNSMDGLIAYYNPVVVTTDSLAIDRKVNKVFNEFGGRKAGQYACRFLKLAEDREHDAAVCDDTRALLDDVPSLERLIHVLIEAVGGLPWGHPEPYFRPSRQDDGRFTLDTNIAFDSLGRVSGRSIDAAMLIAYIASSRSKLMVASDYRADIDTNDIDRVLLAAHVEHALQRRSESGDTLLRLQELTLGPGNTVAEAIRGGERSFDELLHLLDKAEPFREWLRDQEPGADLLYDFYRRATENTWIQKLPAKSFRWAITTAVDAAALGPVGAALSSAVSVFDALVLEKIAAGYRPNQFVDGELRNFARKRGP